MTDWLADANGGFSVFEERAHGSLALEWISLLGESNGALL
jgi:hypothetical protein